MVFLTPLVFLIQAISSIPLESQTSESTFYKPQQVFETYRHGLSKKHFAMEDRPANSYENNLQIGFEYIVDKLRVPENEIHLSSAFEDPYGTVHMYIVRMNNNVEV
jgi:hypothetical protein